VTYDPSELPKWAAAFLEELPATTERIADLFGLDDPEAAAGLAHLEATNWVVRLAGRGSSVWYPVGPAIAADESRPIAVRVLALLPATIQQLRGALPDLTGRQISSAINTQRGAGRVRQRGTAWDRVPAETG
jgi:hypothetical protein